MTRIGLPILIAIFGLLYIFYIPSDPFATKLVFKLIPMVLIIAYALTRMPAQKQGVHWIVLGGLIFSIMGDGLLVWFVVGLTAFLIGHLFYMTAFFRRWHYAKARFWTIVPLAAFVAYMGWTFTTALQGRGETTLIVPVLLYILVIATMAWSAIMSGQKWLILGSLLFVASDAVLAWNMFISTIPYSGALVMIPYYSAQFFIAHGVKTLTTLPTSTPATTAKSA